MHIAGLVIPVPRDRKADYRAWAARSAALLQSCGCLEVVEAWEDAVLEGRHTDFRKAVAARPDEAIVLVWQIWPDRATLKAAEALMAIDPRFAVPADLPFDASRLILGTFSPLFVVGRVGT